MQIAFGVEKFRIRKYDVCESALQVASKFAK